MRVKLFLKAFFVTLSLISSVNLTAADQAPEKDLWDDVDTKAANESKPTQKTNTTSKSN